MDGGMSAADLLIGLELTASVLVGQRLCNLMEEEF